jgi:hypothetical protein
MQPGKMAVDALHGKIYVADGTGGEAIRRFDLDGANGSTVVNGLGAACTGLALDVENGIIYFVTSGSGASDDTLRKVNFDGTGLATLHSGNSVFVQPSGVALDSQLGKIYVADGTGGNAIVSFNLDGSGGATVVNGLGSPCVDLALDSASQEIYFITSSSTASGDTLRRIDSDGSNMAVLHSGNTVFMQPTALAVDSRAGKIYVADGTGGEAVRQFDLDGSNGQTLIGSLGEASGGVAILSAPAVLSVSSTAPDGFYTTGDAIAITVSFDQPVTVAGGTPRLQLNSGGGSFADYFSGSGGTTLQFVYNVAAGEASADLDYVGTASLSLNGGSITGFESQPADLALPSPGSAGSLGGSRNIAIDAINDSPAIAGTVTGQSVDDNATIAPFASVTVADSDFPAQALQVAVSLDDAAKGQFSTLNGFADAGAGTYTFTGIATAATAAIRGLVFTPAANRTPVGGTETATFTISVSDGLAPPVTDAATTVISTSVNDAPIAVNDAITRPSGGTVKVAIAELLANDTDADGDTLTLTLPSGTSANGALISIQGSWVTYSAPVNDSPDSFAYLAHDPNGGTSLGTVFVTVESSNEQSRNLLSVTNDGADKVIQFAAIPLRSYSLEYTLDLGSPAWTFLEQRTASASGFLEFRDVNPPNPNRFYRTVSP